MKKILKIKVLYKYVDGAHFFIAGDEMSKGLCVAAASLDAAYKEVTDQINVLAKENLGQEIEYKPLVPEEELLHWVKSSAEPVNHIHPLPQALLSWGGATAVAA